MLNGVKVTFFEAMYEPARGAHEVVTDSRLRVEIVQPRKYQPVPSSVTELEYIPLSLLL